LKEKMRRKGRNSKFPLILRRKKNWKIPVVIGKPGQDPNAIRPGYRINVAHGNCVRATGLPDVNR